MSSCHKLYEKQNFIFIRNPNKSESLWKNTEFHTLNDITNVPSVPTKYILNKDKLFSVKSYKYIR